MSAIANTPATPGEEVKRYVALAVAAGVVSYRELARLAGRSNTLAQRWGDAEEDGDLPLYVLAVCPELDAFLAPFIRGLRERVTHGAAVTLSPEAGCNVVLRRVAEWIGAASEALTDMHVDPSEARRLLAVANKLRGSLDRVSEQLAERAQEVQ